MTDKTMFTELDQYQWYRDIDELAKHSKFKSMERLLSEIPPAPVSLVLTIMEEMTSRPEVFAAYASAPADGQIGPEEKFLLMWFREYIKHKYGNETQALSEAVYHMRDLANGAYGGVDDPKLRATLLADDSIYDDGAGST
ncbi:hypothetical protein [Pararhizobium sp. IMCC21322]|uniref:hypothetical protein n=1 Tax=Pararhizobium sp. IMCC21322 TaxID=3067903 RepID=UPI002741922B|nr:hypothetical protein [Pararhizobium sp. IMCC21322]